MLLIEQWCSLIIKKRHWTRISISDKTHSNLSFLFIQMRWKEWIVEYPILGNRYLHRLVGIFWTITFQTLQVQSDFTYSLIRTRWMFKIAEKSHRKNWQSTFIKKKKKAIRQWIFMSQKLLYVLLYTITEKANK